MKALVDTVDGVFEIDLETGDVESGVGTLQAPTVNTGLPRVVAAAAAGSTVAAVVDTRPPLLVSHDAGRTWRESGRGLPPGFAVAVSTDDPDLIVFAGRNRLYVSRDGGVFWHALDVEIPDVLVVELTP
jgi:photosystem II stability/assembly factor-like uncharacterized protein